MLDSVVAPQLFIPTIKQDQALALFCKHKEILLEGGSRSGKTFIIVFAIIHRMIKYPKSRHLSVRKHFAHAKTSLWYDTIPKVIEVCFPDIEFKFNKQDWFIETTNGSTYWIGGLDDKDRIEKILGNEYGTIHINEASQTSWKGYEMLKTRLNPVKPMKGFMVSDYNPPSIHHWGYMLFHNSTNPESKEIVNNKKRYAYLQMNPQDNIKNLSDDYIENLESLSESQRKRFLEGKYSDGSQFALWKWDWIINNRISGQLPDFSRIVIGVDPAVSNSETADDTGIMVVGELKGEYYVIDDCTYSGEVTGWARQVCQLYKKYECDRVIGENNQGGDLVEANIRNFNRNIPYTGVRATRGKYTRAEPIAELYRQNKVHHCAEFSALEEEMTTWEANSGMKSPDRMDALVWAIAYLSGSYSYTGNVKVTGI